jgi:hypothetical protein
MYDLTHRNTAFKEPLPRGAPVQPARFVMREDFGDIGQLQMPKRFSPQDDRSRRNHGGNR